MIATKVRDTDDLKIKERLTRLCSELGIDINEQIEKEFMSFYKENSHLLKNEEYSVNISGFSFISEEEKEFDEKAKELLQKIK